MSAACSLGILLAVSLTVANGGRRLIADCHPGLLDPLLPMDKGSGRTDCPFDPTRIYVSACFFQPFCSLQGLGPAFSTTPTCHSCPAPSQFPTLPLHLLGYSLGSLDPFFGHVCRRGCSIWLLLCGCTHLTWGWALQEGRASGAGKEEEQEGLIQNRLPVIQGKSTNSILPYSWSN